ncbi:hypothetical protein [Streptomyces sp. 5-10]|uniref:hypothetical protein n=1 Tax=Streptomyces sp. 5-10 TaxID=878925 RepID=UPI00168A6252|nr:hypothetical protein [Streptomyces sp. 5-10]MBD3004520.1 hypothetical protein [Streptomyces sp. 5-10]
MMDLTAFRSDLTEVIDNLDDTGPVYLKKYKDTVAEVRSATPEGERRYAKSALGVFRYLEELGTGIPDELVRLGVDTLAALGELAERHQQLVASGASFSRYPEDCLPDEGSLTVNDALARLYFGDDYPGQTEDPYAWFCTCAHLQAEADRRGMSTELPMPNADDEDEPTFVELAVASGHTPESLATFGINALDQGVPLAKLADLLGSEPVPADVAALPEYSDHWFRELTESGLSHAETASFFRKGLGRKANDAVHLVKCGAITADEIKELLASGISIPLVRRASRDGLTPDEWKVQVPKIQHLKYKGVGEFGTEGGVLPFRLLVEATDLKVSLVRWDNNSMPVEEERKRRFFHADAEKRQSMYPWNLVYPDHVLNLARAGVSPSFISALGKLMREQDHWGPNSFADLAIQVHGLGLTTDMINAMSRLDSKRPKFSPAQLVAVLEEGLSGTGVTHYLADRYAKPEQWISDLRERRERQLVTDAFVATVEHTEAWRAVRDAALKMKDMIKSRALRGEIYLKEIVEKFLADKPLNDRELAILLNQTAYSFDSRNLLLKTWQEEYAQQKDAVHQLAKNFSDMSKAPTTRR